MHNNVLKGNLNRKNIEEENEENKEQILANFAERNKNKKPSKSLIDNNHDVAKGGSSKASKTTNNPQDKRSKTVNIPRNFRDEVRKY